MSCAPQTYMQMLLTRPNKILSGVLIGTMIAGTVVTLYFVDPPPKVEPLALQFESIAEEKPLPVVAPIREQPIEPLVIKETKVEAKRPVVALSHEDDETDFFALAEKQMAEGNLEEAFQSLRKHLFTNEPTPELLLHLGTIGRELKEHAIAEQALMDAGDLDPTRSEIHVELSRVLLDVGELKRARHAARQAIRLDKNNAAAWNLAGRVGLAESHWQRSEMAFRHALELDPTNAMIHNNIGLLYIMMKEADLAIDSLETAVELYEDEAPYFVFNNLGLAHELALNLEEARAAFEESLLVNPFYSRAKVNLNRIETTLAAVTEKNAFQTARAMNEEDLLTEEDFEEIEDVDIDDI